MEQAPQPPKKRSLKRFLKRTFLVLAVLYAVLLLLIYSLQEKLIFHPRPITTAKSDSVSNSNAAAENISLKMKDGTTVRGWLVKTDTLPRHPLIIYYGGNAEEVSHWVNKSSIFSGYTMALVNYRGYGLSEGEPSEKNLFSDALEVFDQLKKRPDIDADKIFVIGRSLGTGVATYVSAQRRVKATVLITPFENMAAVAQEKYPYIPVSPFLKHRFNSMEMAAAIETPMLTLIASEDEMIPPPHAEKLVKAWKGKNSSVVLEGEDHGSIMKSEKGFAEINRFLGSLD